MDYTSAKYINPLGGLLVEQADGIFFYCPPGTAEHAAIVAHFGEDFIEEYVEDEPPEPESDEPDAPGAEAS